MNVYEEFYPLAVEMLDEFGADALLIRSAPQAPTLAEKRAGRLSGSSLPLQTPVRVAVGPQLVAGADGRQTYQSIATMLVEPHEGDRLALGFNSYSIGSVTTVAPQGQTIVYMAVVS